MSSLIVKHLLPQYLEFVLLHKEKTDAAQSISWQLSKELIVQ